MILILCVTCIKGQEQKGDCTNNTSKEQTVTENPCTRKTVRRVYVSTGEGGIWRITFEGEGMSGMNPFSDLLDYLNFSL